MLMRINHNPVRAHRSASLGNATIDHHFAVNTRAVSLQHKLTGFQGDTWRNARTGSVKLSPLSLLWQNTPDAG